jgi:hypothetical protein
MTGRFVILNGVKNLLRLIIPALPAGEDFSLSHRMTRLFSYQPRHKHRIRLVFITF